MQKRAFGYTQFFTVADDAELAQTQGGIIVPVNLASPAVLKRSLEKLQPSKRRDEPLIDVDAGDFSSRRFTNEGSPNNNA